MLDSYLVDGGGVLVVVEGGDEDGEGVDMVDANSELVLQHPSSLVTHADQHLRPLGHGGGVKEVVDEAGHDGREADPEQHPLHPVHPPVPGVAPPPPRRRRHRHEAVLAEHLGRWRVQQATTFLPRCAHFLLDQFPPSYCFLNLELSAARTGASLALPFPVPCSKVSKKKEVCSDRDRERRAEVAVLQSYLTTSPYSQASIFYSRPGGVGAMAHTSTYYSKLYLLSDAHLTTPRIHALSLSLYLTLSLPAMVKAQGGEDKEEQAWRSSASQKHKKKHKKNKNMGVLPKSRI